jgi:hypothetical protein
MIGTWIRTWYDRLRSAGARWRLRCWRGNLHDLNTRRLAAAVRKLRPRDASLYPAAVNYLQLCLASRLLDDRRGNEFCALISRCFSRNGWYSTAWKIASPGQFVGRLITSCLSEQSNRVEAVTWAAVCFARFRKCSPERVPEAFALALEMAENGYSGAVPVRMYREYLACSGKAPDSPEYRLVEAVMNRPKEAPLSATTLNRSSLEQH